MNASTSLITGLLGGQSNLQAASNAAAPYLASAIGNTFGHGENKNETAQAIGHFILGASLAYINGSDPLQGGSAALAAEKTAQYIAARYNDGKTAIDPETGEFNPNLLPENIKQEISATTSLIASAVGASGGKDRGVSAQTGGVLGKNAVENNWLHSQTAKQKGWLSKEEVILLDQLAKESGSHSIEYFTEKEQKIRQSNMNHVAKEEALLNLKREYESDSRKMEAAAAKLPKGSKERGILFTIATKMQGILSSLPPYEKSEFIRAEQRDWLLVSYPNFHNDDSGFVAIQRHWAVNDGSTQEEALFQIEIPVGWRGSKSTPTYGVTSRVIKEERSSRFGNTLKTLTKSGTVELFTDKRGAQVKGAASVSPIDPKAIATDARSMSNIPTGSQTRVIANNPYIPKQAGGKFTIMDYLPEAARITKKGGEIIINGSLSNKYLRDIPNEAELAQMGLKLKYNRSLKKEFRKFNFTHTDGRPIDPNKMKTIIFEKVK